MKKKEENRGQSKSKNNNNNNPFLREQINDEIWQNCH